jgi:tetratricopeptide (TPR) repeat protein
MRLRLELARVLEDRAGDPAAAQRQIEKAIQGDPSESEPLAELDRLLPITGQYREAAEILAGLLEGDHGLPHDVARDLWTKIASFRRERLDDERGAELAYRKALAHDPENLDLLRTIEGLQRAPGREADLIETLRLRAKLEGGLEDKRVLLREAHTLSSTVLGDAAQAELIARELLREDEANAWALEQLTTARASAKDWTEVLALLLRRAELAPEAAEQSSLRHEAARVARQELGDREKATELYRELLDGSDGGTSDAAATTALIELYREGRRFSDLAELLGRLVDDARTPGDRSRLRLELAGVQRDDLDRPEDAIETLRAIIDEEATNVEAVRALAAIYERLGRNEDLAELLARQIERATEANDVTAELSLRVRLGELQAGVLADPARAIETYEAVLAREPRHLGALEALAKLHEARGDKAKQADVVERLVEEASGLDGARLALDLASLRGDLGDDDRRERALRDALDRSEVTVVASAAAGPSEAQVLAARARKELRDLYERREKWADLAALLVTEADLDEDPKRAAAYLRQGAEIHLEKRESPSEAAVLLERATKLQPDDRPLLLLLCDALSASGRGSEAADILRKIIESFGGKRSKELALYHHRLAHALQAQDDRERALQEYDLAFKIDPGNIVVLRDLGKLALDVGDLERAQKTFRALLLQKLDKTSGITKGEVFFYLGEISDRQGDRGKALQMFERAVETDPALGKAKDRASELKAAGVSGSSLRPPSLSPPARKPEEST